MRPAFRIRTSLRIPLLFFCAAMALFTAERFAIFVALRERFASATGAEVLRAFLVGLRFDAVSAATLTLPVVAVLAVAWRRLLARRGFRALVSGLASLLLAFAAFAGIADFYFFKEFDERLNHKALAYLGHGYTYRVIWDQYPVVLTFVATALVLAGVAWVVGRVGFPPARDAADAGAAPRRGVLRRTVPHLAIVAAEVVLLLLAVRGTIGPKAINTGPAYFSNSPSLAQLTLNGLFTLREAANSMTYKDEDLAEHLDLLPESQALDLAARLIVRPKDRSLGDTENPLRRVTETGRARDDYNVVVVVLESIHWSYVGAMGGDARLTPELDRLASEGVLFDHCFAVGDRTTRGFSGIVGGFPDLPGQSVTTRLESEGNFLTLGDVLGEQRGYQTMFVYAGQPLYDHRQSFLRSNGFRHMVFENGLKSRTFRTDLGWCDEDLFDQAHREFEAASATGKPFFATLLTLSFHRPYRVPPGRVDRVDAGDGNGGHDDQLTCVRYTDWAIGRFMEKARRSAYFDRTLFVFVADHMGGYKEHPVTPVMFRVPFILYGPKVLADVGSAGRRVSTVCSQTDVAPTILSVLGGSYEHCFFGSDVLGRPAEAGFALMQRSSGELSLMSADGDVAVVPFDAPAKLFRFMAPSTLTPVAADHEAAAASRREELRRQGVALLQTASTVYDRGAHNLRGAQGR